MSDAQSPPAEADVEDFAGPPAYRRKGSRVADNPNNSFKWWEKSTARRRFIESYQQTGDIERSAAHVGRHPKTIIEWRKKSPHFRGQMEEVEASFVDLAKARISNLNTTAVDAVERGLLLSDPKAAAELGFKLLKQANVLQPDRVITEHTGEVKVPIRITSVEAVIPEAKIIDVESRMLPDGDASPE